MIPLALLALSIAAWVGSDRLGNAEVATPIAEPTLSSETPMLSARRLPEFIIQPLAEDALRSELDAVVSSESGGTCLLVTDGAETLYGHQQDFGFTPASLQKIVTGYAAIERLNPNENFETRLMAEAEPENGVLNGNLYLVGGGDPLLMTQDYALSYRNQPQIRTSIEELADQVLANYGITTITGGVHGVEVRYDQDRYPDSWPDRYAEQSQSGPLSALMVNDGFTEWPLTAGAREISQVSAAADDPALQAAAAFDDLLEAQQVIINGGSRNVSRQDWDAISGNLVTLATVESPPISEIVKQMMQESDNTTAELLLKEIGFQESNAGTTPVGARALVTVLSDAGLSRLEIPPLDGSGLDPGNKLTCSFLVDILRQVQPETPFGQSFPVAGESGTLVDRFVGTLAEGRVHAKTGSLNDVTALSGWVEADEGRTLQFAYIVNLAGGRTVTDAMVRLQDRLVEAMVQYPVGPSVLEIAPRAASDIEAEALGLDDDLGEGVEIEGAPTEGEETDSGDGDGG